MKNKLMAAACAVLALAVTLAACGNKYLVITDAYGNTHLAVTDAEGNTVLNQNGDIEVYVTDEDGDPVTLENGGYDIGGIPFPNLVSDGNTIETPDYTLTMPDGWTADKNGRFVRDDNANTYIQVSDLGALDNGETLDTYFASQREGQEAFLAQVQEQYPNAELGYDTHLFTAKQIDSRLVDFRVPQDDGTMFYYALNIYYVYKDKLFKVDYVCSNGSYDETFDVLGVLDYNLVMK